MTMTMMNNIAAWIVGFCVLSLPIFIIIMIIFDDDSKPKSGQKA